MKHKKQKHLTKEDIENQELLQASAEATRLILESQIPGLIDDNSPFNPDLTEDEAQKIIKKLAKKKDSR